MLLYWTNRWIDLIRELFDVRIGLSKRRHYADRINAFRSARKRTAKKAKLAFFYRNKRLYLSRDICQGSRDDMRRGGKIPKYNTNHN